MAGHRSPEEIAREKAGLPPAKPAGDSPDYLGELFGGVATGKSKKTLQDFTRAELASTITKYFSNCMEMVADPDTGIVSYEIARNPTLAGLAVAVGSTAYHLKNLEPGDAHFDLLTTAKQLIAKYYEEALVNSKKNPAGIIFALKQLGYSDETVVQLGKAADAPRPVEDIRAAIASELSE